MPKWKDERRQPPKSTKRDLTRVLTRVRFLDVKFTVCSIVGPICCSSFPVRRLLLDRLPLGVCVWMGVETRALVRDQVRGLARHPTQSDAGNGDSVSLATGAYLHVVHLKARVVSVMFASARP